jgi:hypothetical protein
MTIGLIGPIVDDFGVTAPASGAAPVNTGDGYDFNIAGLDFRLAPTDKWPYQRGTAQFQKDQLDTGHTAGDQSLTGWWTRGQFSFHKGAGIVYYDTGTTVRLNEDLTPLNHFADAEGVDPFSPGKVTCQRAWTAYSALVGSVSYVSSIGTNLVVLDGTTLKYGDFNAAPVSYVPSGAATVRAATTSPVLAYALLDNGKIASVATGGTETTLYTGLTTTARGIWYAKSRLIASDSNGKWYQLSTHPTTPPVAVASTDVIFTAGDDWATSSVLCDTPGPMLIGNANRVFALTLDSQGSVPTLTAPVQIAELPPGETISGLAFALGFVIIVTGAGVRVGLLSDNGQLTYGPLLVERASATTTPPATSIARYGTRAAVVVDSRIIEIDLSQQVGQGLEFAWTGRGDPFAGTETAAGVTTLGYSTQVAWGNNALWNSSATANYAQGWLQTGFHRFAILEPKRFDSVRVHLSGTSGTCLVERVSSDGAIISLYTIDVAQSHVEEIDLKYTTGQEVVALRFTLTPDAAHPTVTPVLLGYQLRALPEPRRQRMVKVPILLQDTERRQPAGMTGRAGSAWSRLQALEQAENTGAIVSFTDYRTGETGRAYIESVEFENTTPPTSRSTGFGGIGFITLRKLS